jgi:hypothetical protein
MNSNRPPVFSFQNNGFQPPLIHIGYPKCISSWLQQHLFQPQYGYTTVMNPVLVQLNLIDPVPLAFDPAHMEKFLNDRVTSEIIGDRIPVITSEALSGNMFCGGYNSKELANRLFEIFPEGKVLIIVREQKSMIRSLYSTIVSWGMPHSIERLLAPVDARKIPQYNSVYLQYDRLVSYYRNLFGEGNVLVLCFEQFKEDAARFIQSICDFSNNSHMTASLMATLPFHSRANVSRILVNLFFQRWYNYFLVSNAANYSGLFKDTPEATMKRLRDCRRRNKRFPKFMATWFEKDFKDKVREKTQGQFRESNRRLSQIMNVDLGSYGYET